MSSAGVLNSYVKIILVIVTLVGSAKASVSASTMQGNGTEEGERLAGFLYEQFRRDLGSGAGLKSKLPQNNGLLVIRGIKFRTVVKGILLALTEQLFTILSIYPYYF